MAKRTNTGKADEAIARASAHLYNAARAYVMAVDAVTIGGKTGRKSTDRAAMTEIHLVDVAFEYVDAATMCEHV